MRGRGIDAGRAALPRRPPRPGATSCSSTAGPARARSPASSPPRSPSTTRRPGCGSTPTSPCSPTRAAASRTFGTRDDFLIPSACLNSTVSGLVSRTVLNDRPDRPGRLPRREVLRASWPAPTSPNDFLDAVAARFDGRRRRGRRRRPALPPATATPTWAGWARRRADQRASTASATSTSSSPASARPPGCCCAGCRGGCWSRAGAAGADLAHVRLLAAAARACPVEEVAGPALHLRRADPPPVHARRHRRRRARGGRPRERPSVVCLDLDRTLIYSAAALDLRDARPRGPAAAVRRGLRGRAAVVHDRGGGRRCCAELQRRRHRRADHHPHPEQLARVHLPGPPAAVRDREQRRAPARRRRRRPGLGGRGARSGWPGCAPLAEVQAHLRRVAAAVRAERCAIASGPVRLRRGRRARAARRLGGRARPRGAPPRGWTVSLQGRKVYARARGR